MAGPDLPPYAASVGRTGGRHETLQSRGEQARQLRLEADLEATVQSEEVGQAIRQALQDFLAERPEAEALLRGRTFARALH